MFEGSSQLSFGAGRLVGAAWLRHDQQTPAAAAVCAVVAACVRCVFYILVFWYRPEGRKGLKCVFIIRPGHMPRGVFSRLQNHSSGGRLLALSRYTVFIVLIVLQFTIAHGLDLCNPSYDGHIFRAELQRGRT